VPLFYRADVLFELQAIDAAAEDPDARPGGPCFIPLGL